MSRKAAAVYGVEVIPEAIHDARENALINQLDNVEFFVGKAEEVLPEYYDHHLTSEESHPDIIVVDPPRKGCDEKCIETMLLMKPSKIIYVSCNPSTLARDLKMLCASDYHLEKVTPIDQFCHSLHVETVVLLSKQKPCEKQKNICEDKVVSVERA